MSGRRSNRVQCPTKPGAPPKGGVEFFQGTLAHTDEIDNVRVFDTTLRDGEQTPRTSFSYEDKRDIAATLSEMGTHVVEAGFPANGDAEFEAVSDVAESTDATTCALARVVEGDVETALDTGAEMIHVFVSTSDVQIEDSMHATREDVKTRAVEAVERVAEAGAIPMFSPMDATRTDDAFLAEIVEAVTEAGTEWINIPDTCGVATPARFADLVTRVREHTDARIDVHTHDDFGMATANAMAGLEAGAEQVQVSVNGIGERAGNAAFEEVVMAAEGVYGVDTGVVTERIADLSRTVEERSDVPVPANKPVVGANAFSHESGIHAAGVIENSDTFETGVMTPEMVGATREFVLGKHSGAHAVRRHLTRAGFTPTDAEVRTITRKVKDRGAADQQVTSADVRRFARELGVEQEATA